MYVIVQYERQFPPVVPAIGGRLIYSNLKDKMTTEIVAMVA
jgi:hypothetical protein